MQNAIQEARNHPRVRRLLQEDTNNSLQWFQAAKLYHRFLAEDVKNRAGYLVLVIAGINDKYGVAWADVVKARFTEIRAAEKAYFRRGGKIRINEV